MFPNQGFPGQYPAQQMPFGAAYPPQQPGIGQMPLAQPLYGQPFIGQPGFNQLPFGQPSNQQPAVEAGRPTVVPATNFDALKDAATLRKAMKGFGTDENALINVLCRRTNDQRVQIVRAFKTAYGKDLFDEIRSETSGNFRSVLIALLYPKIEYYCRELYEAMEGAGTDENALIDIMCTMFNHEIRIICETYQKMYNKSLESDLRSDTSGNMKRLMTSLCCGGRDESMRTDVNSARTDAEVLKKAGIDRFGTDESEFNRILCTRNFEQIKIISQEYEKLTGHTLENDIKSEFSGDIKNALIAIVQVSINRPDFFARRLHKSMAGLGTNDRSLIRLCVTRCEIDMKDIKDAFQKLYSKTLVSFVKGDTSGDYRKALYTLIGEN